MTRRYALVLGTTVILLTGCGIRDTRTKVVERDGHEFLCSYTHNNISGNESEQQCALVPEDTSGVQP